MHAFQILSITLKTKGDLFMRGELSCIIKSFQIKLRLANRSSYFVQPNCSHLVSGINLNLKFLSFSFPKKLFDMD